jgi:hypothetical protein
MIRMTQQASDQPIQGLQTEQIEQTDRVLTASLKKKTLPGHPNLAYSYRYTAVESRYDDAWVTDFNADSRELQSCRVSEPNGIMFDSSRIKARFRKRTNYIVLCKAIIRWYSIRCWLLNQ